MPALEELARYLSWASPDALPALEAAADVARRFHDPVTIRALGGYQALGPGERDTLTIALSQLTARMHRLTFVQRSRGHGAEHDTALWHLRGAWYLDQLHRATAGEGFEAAFHSGSLWTLANLRAARPHVEDAESFQQSRMADYFLDIPVFAAFDAIAHVSHTTGTDYVVQP